MEVTSLLQLFGGAMQFFLHRDAFSISKGYGAWRQAASQRAPPAPRLFSHGFPSIDFEDDEGLALGFLSTQQPQPPLKSGRYDARKARTV